MNIPANSGTVLDGFTITGGNADGSGNITINTPFADSTVTTTIDRNSGGGMYSVSSLPGNTSAPELTNVVISVNSANNRGGGIYNVSTAGYAPASPVLNNVTVSENSAMDGGGICNYNFLTGSSSSSVLTNVTISGNDASDRGGGMYNNSSSPVLINAAISGNSTFGSGGGMYNSSSSPVLINAAISGNSTFGSGGGGMYNHQSSPVLINVAIFGNLASGTSGGGGGMYNANSSSPVLINVAVSGNAANNSGGGGIYNYNSSSPKIRNSIIWGNTATSGSANIENSSGCNPTITYSIVEDGGYPSSSPDADGNMTVDPQFEDWQDPSSVSMPNSDGDYRLQNTPVTSPAIDAGDKDLYPNTWSKWSNLVGTSTGINTETKYDTYISPYINKDLDGNDRILGSPLKIDMGAYEKE
jgi:hypothetical protein